MGVLSFFSIFCRKPVTKKTKVKTKRTWIRGHNLRYIRNWSRGDNLRQLKS